MFPKRVDSNQVEIVRALVSMQCTVVHLHTLGKGVPDILVGCRGINVLVEIKDGEKALSKRQLNATQIAWHANWRGLTPVVISSSDEARALVNYCNSRRTNDL